MQWYMWKVPADLPSRTDMVDDKGNIVATVSSEHDGIYHWKLHLAGGSDANGSSFTLEQAKEATLSRVKRVLKSVPQTVL